ncbi:hypothetical protein [Nocardia sp. NPDC020380]|uniref:hypothetical protein n=1 Tax=Nocardia sp. NPDC020380 TaxID=3364309 RepID=UPI00379D5500
MTTPDRFWEIGGMNKLSGSREMNCVAVEYISSPGIENITFTAGAGHAPNTVFPGGEGLHPDLHREPYDSGAAAT